MKNFALCGVVGYLRPVIALRMRVPTESIQFGRVAEWQTLRRTKKAARQAALHVVPCGFDSRLAHQSSGDRVCHGRSRYASATRGRCVGKF